MNERIRLLAEQAEKYADDNFKGELGWSEAYESKFAELIIRECCDIADEVEQADTGMFVSKYIQAHFGVER